MLPDDQSFRFCTNCSARIFMVDGLKSMCMGYGHYTHKMINIFNLIYLIEGMEDTHFYNMSGRI